MLVKLDELMIGEMSVKLDELMTWVSVNYFITIINNKFAIRQCAASASTISLINILRKEKTIRNQHKKETYAQSLTPFCTSFWLNLCLQSLLLPAHYMLLVMVPSTEQPGEKIDQLPSPG